jgi:Fe-S-cluster-containing dehydrogenase component
MPTTPASDAWAEEKPEVVSPCATRREFIKRGAHALGASVVTLIIYDSVKSAHAQDPDSQPVAPSAAAAGEMPARDYDWTKHSYVYLIDVRKCIGCGSCARACSNENNVPERYFRTWIERYQISRTGEVLVDSPKGGMDGFDPTVTGKDITKAFFFPKLCCHCTFTPCVQLCPVGASYRTLDGVVLVDEKRCIGCGYCVQACPYGSRFIHPDKHVASKCTLCYHRITHGLPTACVQACPVGARRLGDLKKIGDEVAEIIATQRVQILQAGLLTEPNCYYLGLTKEAR